MGYIYIGLIILIVVLLSKGKSSGTGGTRHDYSHKEPGALPPDMYDPMYDYDNDGKMSEWEKCDQIEMWDDMWSGSDDD